MCVAQAADIFGTGVVAGAFLMGSFAIHPAAARLGASAQVLFRQELICRLSRWMPSFMLLPVFAAIGALTLCRTSVPWTLDAVGLTPITPKKKVVFITPEIAETYAPVRITVAYAGQNPVPKPFVMVLLWIKTANGWKMTTDIPIPVPPDQTPH